MVAQNSSNSFRNLPSIVTVVCLDIYRIYCGHSHFLRLYAVQFHKEEPNDY